jgi:exopolysaccharide biosynthesis predicted pyruvyltransferase EpsI
MQLDQLPSIETTLENYRGRKVYFDLLKGNNGDILIELGSRHALERFGITTVDSPRQADLIFINGGGAMTRDWLVGFAALEKYNQSFPDIPLLVFPSTFDINEVDFAHMFTKRRSPAWLYAREKFSLDCLKKVSFPCEVRLGLDHDMAFNLRNTPLLTKLRRTAKESHILIVERGDREASTEYSEAALAPRCIGTILKKGVPPIVKAPFKRWIIRNRASNTSFVRNTIERLLAEHPHLDEEALFAGNISRKDAFSFNLFCRAVADARLVVTTRLHVAILAAMLGKRTYIQPGRPGYPKLQEVYNFSLRNLPNVQML